MVQKILYGQEAREKLISGVQMVSDAVKVTLGPKGRTVLLGQKSGSGLIVKDCAALMNAMDLEDPHESIGVRIIKEMAEAVHDSAGDGCATAVVLANAILQEGLKNIAAGANAMELRKGIQGAVQLSCAAVKKVARPVEGLADIRHISSVSAGNEEAGELVGRIVEEIGTEGILSVEETPYTETTMEITRGMQYEKGYLNVEFLKDPGSMRQELEHPCILVTDYEISGAQELLPLLEQVHVVSRPLLIIAESITGSALSMLLLNKKQGVVDVVGVHPPAYGDGRRDRMEDICVFTGGVFVSERMGYRLQDVKLEMLGTAERVIVSKNNTAIINGNGDPEAIRMHLAGLRRFIETEDYGFKKDRLKERLAKFSSGTAVIRVGAPTEPETKELKYRMENAVQAVKAAVEEGIVPGGGTVYLDILPAVRAYAATLEGDRRAGAFIVLRALEAPARQIAENGGKDPSVVTAQIKGQKRGWGYDVQEDTFVDMLEKGIVDSAKAARLALQCAASAASTLLTAEAGLAGEAENKQP